MVEGGKLLLFLQFFNQSREFSTLNHLLCTVNDGLNLKHHESFPVHGVFCAQQRKFSTSKHLPCTAAIHIFEDKRCTALNLATMLYFYLKNFAWADQRAKECFIFHKAQLRCQECFIEQEQCFMKLQSLIKYSYA